MKKSTENLSTLSLSQKIFSGLLILLIGLNLFGFMKEFFSYQKIRRFFPHQFAGYKFLGLQSVLKGEPIIGYYTDKNLDDPKNNKDFSQAQFVLAPIILDVNNMRHRYIILDCSNKDIALEKMNKLNASPVKVSSTGIILVERKP
ncbi:MAG: hypothetical protein HQL24_08180 [Candidatus Omnitrophica bacterium]|nr:hypothetical protein [Candidatus Omnitrophota bacterium]